MITHDFKVGDRVQVTGVPFWNSRIFGWVGTVIFVDKSKVKVVMDRKSLYKDYHFCYEHIELLTKMPSFTRELL